MTTTTSPATTSPAVGPIRAAWSPVELRANPYDRVTPFYGTIHRLWLASSGGTVERRLLAELATVVKAGDRVLEIGAGTGRVTRRIQALAPEARTVALDSSTAMLSRAPTSVRRIVGDALHLQFPAGSFDVVISAWTVETTADSRQALDECARMLRPGGHLLCWHTAQPQGLLRRATSLPTRALVGHCFGGCFLPTPTVLPEQLDVLATWSSRRGLAAGFHARRRPDR